MAPSPLTVHGFAALQKDGFGSRPGTPKSTYITQLSPKSSTFLGGSQSSCTLSRPSTQSRSDPRYLARSGWHVLGPQPVRPTVAQSLESEGARLVNQLASSWCSKYSYTIKKQGAQGESFHYECIFSQPANSMPVPSTVVRAFFALVCPQDALQQLLQQPRLVFSFEEADLRQEWSLERGADGYWQTVRGQQHLTLRAGYFETFLDKFILEKEQCRSRGVPLTTSFETTRLEKPPLACEDGSEDESDGRVEAGGWSRMASPMSDQWRSERSNRKGSADMGVPVISHVDYELQQALKSALKVAGIVGDKVAPPSSLTELLSNVFDAADEDEVGELPHHEVAKLLEATLVGFGLVQWDIQLLLTAAHENEAGFIACKPFIQIAPELIQELRRRRLNFRARGMPTAVVSHEAVQHCHGAEIAELSDKLVELFTMKVSEDPTHAKWLTEETLSPPRSPSRSSVGGGMRKSSIGSSKPSSPSRGGSKRNLTAWDTNTEGVDRRLIGIHRRDGVECIQMSTFSPQEAQRVMQMLPEDEDGFVLFEELVGVLENMRVGALMNALVETDVASLRKHLVLCCRHVGLSDDGTMKVWKLRMALMQADQICVSRQQIFALLCLAQSACDSDGNVDVDAFVGTLCVVIPHMFDAKIFVVAAERLQAEAAEQQKARENAELAAMAAKGGQKQEEKETQQETIADLDTVEKLLIGLFQANDAEKRNPAVLSPLKMCRLMLSGDQVVQNCQLTETELCGFVAEMLLDVNGEVHYMDHVKRVVPMIFNLRRNLLLVEYVKEGAFEALKIPSPNANALREVCALLPPERRLSVIEGESQRRSSKRSSGRRCSKEGRDSARLLKRSPTNWSRQVTEPSSGKRATEEEVEYAARVRIHARVSASVVGSKSPHGTRDLNESRETPHGRGYERRKGRLTVGA